jgi:drug/metabolite transporter (DMT)-like permease
VPLAFAGIALGIVSIVLVSQQTSHQHEATSSARATGVGTAFVSGVAIGFFFLSVARTGSEAGMWPLLVSRGLSVTMFAVIAIAGRRSIRMRADVLMLAVVCGVVDMLANALYLLAARQGPLSTVVTLSSLYPASTVLLARVVLGERVRRLQEAGIVAALAGVALIAAILAWEHAIVRPRDLSRLDMAFFNLNGYVSVAFFVAVLGDVLVH